MVDATRFTHFPLNPEESVRAKGLALRARVRAGRLANRERILAELGMTRPESALFTAVYYGSTIPAAQLPRRAVMEDYSEDGTRVTEEACRDALAACFAKGWLRVIDAAALAKIAEELAEGQFLGPIYGLPQVGDVDFTASGAQLFQRRFALCRSADLELHRRLFPHSGLLTEPPTAYADVVRNKTFKYFKTKAAAFAAMEEARTEYDFVSASGPDPIGPWRVQWWRLFPEGYRIDIDQRRQWQGRGSGGGEDCFMDYSSKKPDSQRLRHILDRHHLKPAHWVLFAAMERNWYMRSMPRLPVWVSESAEKSCGMAVSEEECRAALQGCLHDGWLRVVDGEAVDQVNALLQNEPGSMPVPSVTHCKLEHVDFTPRGAVLYRMLAATWLGPNWEDGLHVHKEHYWEEHHYCESVAGFRRIVKEREERGNTVLASRIVPLGPWCINWWDRFPSGYRLELEMGDP
jgi:hypothetical protein